MLENTNPDDTEQYVCPNCGDDRFSWTVTQVQFGPIEAVGVDDTASPVGDQMGEIVDSDDDPVYCTRCDTEIALDELILDSEYEADADNADTA